MTMPLAQELRLGIAGRVVSRRESAVSGRGRRRDSARWRGGFRPRGLLFLLRPDDRARELVDAGLDLVRGFGRVVARLLARLLLGEAKLIDRLRETRDVAIKLAQQRRQFGGHRRRSRLVIVG